MKKCDCNCECLNGFTDSLRESTAAICLFGISAFLLGVIVGFLLSPLKHGLAVGSYNGAYNKFCDSNNVNREGEKHKCCKKS